MRRLAVVLAAVVTVFCIGAGAIAAIAGALGSFALLVLVPPLVVVLCWVLGEAATKPAQVR